MFDLVHVRMMMFVVIVMVSMGVSDCLAAMNQHRNMRTEHAAFDG